MGGLPCRLAGTKDRCSHVAANYKYSPYHLVAKHGNILT